jgi:hypothetical protein
VVALLIAATVACVAEGTDASPRAAVAAAVPAKQSEPGAVEAEELDVDLGDAPLDGAQPSLDALGRAIVDALNAEDRTALLGIALSPTEYKERLFAALVQHENAYKMGPDLLWDMHAAESNGDLGRALARHGGKNLAFESMAIEREEQRKGGLVFHKRPTIVAKDGDGNEHKIRIVGTIIEHPASGSFKVLGYKTDD